MASLWLLAITFAVAGVVLGVASSGTRSSAAPARSAATAPGPTTGTRRLTLGNRTSTTPRSATILDGARQTALRFIDSYLARSYGQPAAGALLSATPAVRRQLRRLGMRVSSEVAARDPRVLSLHMDAGGPGSEVAVATVDDGALLYAVTVALERRQRGWVVTSVGPS